MTPEERILLQHDIYDTFDKVDPRIRANDLIKWMAACYMAQEVQEMSIKSIAQDILNGAYTISEESEALDYIIEYVENCNDEGDNEFSLELLEEKIREEFDGYQFPAEKIKLNPDLAWVRMEGIHRLTLEEALHLENADWGKDEQPIDFRPYIGKTLRTIAEELDSDHKKINLMYLLRDLFPDKFTIPQNS
jgi:hypothetical protein